MKQILSLLLCLATMLSGVACSEEESGPRPEVGGLHAKEGDLYPTNFLTLDQTQVEFDLFRYYYLNYKNMYLSEDSEYFQKDGNEEKLKEEILDVLCDFYAIRFLAEENDVELDDGDEESIQADIDKTVEFYNGKEAFLGYLEESFMTEELYNYMMEYSALYLKLFNTLYKDDGEKEWSDEKYYDYYEKNYLAAQQIFIPFESGEDEESHPATQSKADEIYAKAKGGEDFWQLIETYGEDKNMLKYPDGYYFTEGQAEDVLYQATAALKKGEISQPVVGKTGLYIIRRMELKKLRMDENRETTLYGYTDSLNEWQSGVYDEEFQKLYEARAEKIKVKKGEHWKEISTETVY